jgi:flagellar hook-associated protein 2
MAGFGRMPGPREVPQILAGTAWFVGCLDFLLEDAMGTVGLSFGSPTSGTGFDVSSTVSEIVANLQNVETPWKTQLSSLESQDTVISNLGSLMSNLSNDVSSLTDFQGILAEKTGSSSDTNVLEITAASSSAVAGTHSLVVNSLAQTSSGSMPEISSASATLSGAITLQVGASGKSQTFALGSSDDTLAGLASAINASNVGIDASVLTDATGSRLSLVSGTSGANGNIIASNNSLAAAASNTLSASVSAGATSGPSSATFSAVLNSSENLTGKLSVTVGSGTAQTINMSDVSTAEGGTTLADLANYINSTANSFPFSASVVNNSDGTASLELTSGTAGSAGTLAVSSSLVDSSTALSYTSAVTGQNASLTVDGVNLTSASNIVTNLIPGVTFQLLSASPEPVQLVIGNDNTDVESTVNQFVSDYNSLISAINTQEGNTNSGTAEPLFGSPTLSLLQDQILGSVNTPNPNGYLDTITNASDTLSGSISFSLADGLPLYYSGTAGTDADTTSGTSATTSSGTLAPIMNSGDTLSGSISIQVGSGSAQTINMSDVSTAEGGTTLADLAGYINAPSNSFGFSAAVAPSSGSGPYILSLTSSTSGTAGTLTVTSNIADTTTQTVQVPTSSGQNTLAGLASAINAAYAGVTASVLTNSSGSQLVLESNFAGSSGALTVTPSISDTATSKALNYNNGDSDINNLTSLGISVNDNGTLTFDASSLDSVLNTDYNSVVGFFQNANGWGQTFSTMLNNAGSSSSTGILSLASTSNSNIESSLNAEISKENAMISADQSSLTAELNSANEIMQQLPSELDGMNELYSAITGYQQNSNG